MLMPLVSNRIAITANRVCTEQ